MTSEDKVYVSAIVSAVEAYATAMNTFTAGAAATAQAAMQTSLTNATTAWAATSGQEGV